MTMTIAEIPQTRLLNLQITQTSFKNPQQLVSWLGVLQSQDFSGAKWAIGLRLGNFNDQQIEQLFNRGQILRTHLLRPTWHFVMPEDIRWILDLTSPQVKKLMSYYNKKLELDTQVLKKTGIIIQDSLTNHNYLTRSEIAKILEKNGITAWGQRLAHIVMEAELNGLICSGPRIGKQFTYALLEERVPKTKKISREEALVKLAKLYFKSRGPASIKDFSKWSYLSIADIKIAVAGIASDFETEVIGGIEYFFPKLYYKIKPPTALLLPNYDEYISSYADYQAISEPIHQQNLQQKGNALFWNHLIIDGMVVGSWRRQISNNIVQLTLSPFRTLTEKENQALHNQITKLGYFLNLPVTVITK